jgi:hypothetical protein
MTGLAWIYPDKIRIKSTDLKVFFELSVTEPDNLPTDTDKHGDHQDQSVKLRSARLWLEWPDKDEVDWLIVLTMLKWKHWTFSGLTYLSRTFEETSFSRRGHATLRTFL